MDCIAAAIGALSRLMSKPTVKKLCKEDMYACPLNRDIYIYIYNVMGSLKSVNKLPNIRAFIAAGKRMVRSTEVGGLISLQNGNLRC